MQAEMGLLFVERGHDFSLGKVSLGYQQPTQLSPAFRNLCKASENGLSGRGRTGDLSSHPGNCESTVRDST